MKLWRVRNVKASWGDNEEMIIVAESPERALEIFDHEDRWIAELGRYATRGPWEKVDLVVEEIPWPAPEGALLVSNVGS